MQAARTHGGSDNITAVVVDVVVGEDGDESVPAVAAVASDFAVPEDNGPSPRPPTSDVRVPGLGGR